MAIEFLLAPGLFAIAATSLYFNYRQHRESVRGRRARAELDVTVRTVEADDEGILWTEPHTSTQYVRVAIGVKNTGDIAAGETVVNVVVPSELRSARWSGPQGEEIPGGDRTAPTTELLRDADGRETVASEYLSSSWPRIGTRPHYEKYVKLSVELPPVESGLKQQVVPMRVRVQADELPDDLEEYVVDHTVRVVRRG